MPGTGRNQAGKSPSHKYPIKNRASSVFSMLVSTSYITSGVPGWECGLNLKCKVRLAPSLEHHLISITMNKQVVWWEWGQAEPQKGLVEIPLWLCSFLIAEIYLAVFHSEDPVDSPDAHCWVITGHQGMTWWEESWINGRKIMSGNGAGWSHRAEPSHLSGREEGGKERCWALSHSRPTLSCSCSGFLSAVGGTSGAFCNI